MSNIPSALHPSYLSYGETRPPIENLSHWVTQLSKQDRPNSKLLLADVLIDLAMTQDDQAHMAIERAQEALSSVIEEAKQVEEGRSYNRYKAYMRYAQAATLRLGELPSWRDASTKNTVGFDYTYFVMHAFQASQFALYGHRTSGFLAEVIPVLLGHRAQTIYRTGWLSRQSLAREDIGNYPAMSPYFNPSWDVGVANDTRSTSYDSPARKIQIKYGSKRRPRYEKANLTFLNALELGFAEADHVIKSCAEELDPYVVDANTDTSDPLTTGELDDLTEQIASAIGIN